MVAVYSELRLRSRVAPEAIAEMKGKIVTDNEYDVLLDGPTRILKPDGKPLAVYLPGALPGDLLEETYATLHSLKASITDNRGDASGTQRVMTPAGRSRTKDVSSAIVGAFESTPPFFYCRLTAWSGREMEQYRDLFPLFEAIAAHFAEHVPDRFAAQMRFVNATHPDWRIGSTPFTTVTVNNTYPTGVHTDAGDLDEGFSTLAVLKKGDYHGGRLVFPEFRVAADMKHGDVLLMDAHEWHGNTALHLDDPLCVQCDAKAVEEVLATTTMLSRPVWRPVCAKHGADLRTNDSIRVTERRAVVPAERISVVCYYRTKMTTCGSFEEEAAKAAAKVEGDHKGIVDEMAAESLGA